MTAVRGMFLSIDHILKEIKKKRLFCKTNSDCEVTFWEEVAGLSWWQPNKQTNKQTEEQDKVQSLTFVQRSHLICFHFT